jgi:ribulose-phosphate 3-epimerase
MRTYQISPSILAADLSCLADALQQCEQAGADRIHLDVMDGHFVPNLTMGPVIVRACRKSTRLPLDVHLMVQEPEHLLAPFAEAGADSLIVHVEASTQLYRTLHTIRSLGAEAGIVLNPATPAVAIAEALAWVELVLVLSVEPGYSGQDFIPETMRKVRTIRTWLDERGSKARIHIDGGISAKTAPLAAQAGAEVFVAASAIFGHPQGIKAGIDALRHALDQEGSG